MTALDWPKEPDQDLLVKLLKEESGVSPELARVLEKESLGLELEKEQEKEQELVGKQREQEQKKGQEKEQEKEPEQKKEQEKEKGKEQGKEPQGAWEGLDMASEVEWLVLKVRVLLDRFLQSQA